MRWSWPSFAGGAAFGALLALLIFTATRAPREGNVVRAAPDAAAATGAPTAAAMPQAADGRAEPTTESPQTGATSTDAVGAPTATKRGRERVHVEPEAPTPPEDEGSADGVVDLADVWLSFGGKDGAVVVARSGGRFTSGGVIRVSWPSTFLGTNDRLTKEDAAAAARAHTATRGPTDDDAIRSLLASDAYDDRAAGLELAARANPPLFEFLLAAFRDTDYPALRATALSLAHDVARGEPEVRAAVLAAARDPQRDVREEAIGLLRHYGRAGATRAGELLAAGEYTAAFLPGLVAAVVGGGQAAAVLAGPLDSDAALALAGQVLRTTDVADPDARAGAYSVASLVRPHLLHAGTGEAAAFFGGAASAGFGDLLAGIAGDATVPDAVRLVAVTAALGQDASRADGLRAFAGLIDDASLSADTIVNALYALDVAHLADDGVQSAARRAAHGHDNPWVRSVAERRLRDAGYTVGAHLVIHSATYGADGKDVDVTARLRSGITGGRLVVAASNDLGGDPSPGAHKTLRVEYSSNSATRLN